MIDDLKEAFALATAKFLIWQRENEEIRYWGTRCENRVETYFEEPTVRVNGEDVPISEISERALILSGPLPPLLREIFLAVTKIAIDPLMLDHYTEAVYYLRTAIRTELNAQERYPLTELCLVDAIRQYERRRVCAAIRHAIMLPTNDVQFDAEAWWTWLKTIDADL